METIYLIKPTLAEEALESWVWTNDDKIKTNGFIIIKNPANNKSIRTFRRTIDVNFQNLYNDRDHTKGMDIDKRTYLLLNEYYRNCLHVKKHSEVELEITKANLFQIVFKTQWSHPNRNVQFANRATLLGLLLGIVSLILAIISLFK